MSDHAAASVANVALQPAAVVARLVQGADTSRGRLLRGTVAACKVVVTDSGIQRVAREEHVQRDPVAQCLRLEQGQLSLVGLTARAAWPKPPTGQEIGKHTCWRTSACR